MYDEADSRLNAFIRLPVADVVLPASPRHFVVGDLVCFRTPLVSTYQPQTAGFLDSSKTAATLWHSAATDGKPNRCLQFLDERNGKLMFTSACDTTVFARLNPVATNVTTSVTVSVLPPAHISFENGPTFVTNVDNREFIFPVALKRFINETTTNVHGLSTGTFLTHDICLGCSKDDLDSFQYVTPPFSCRIRIEGADSTVAAINIFSARPVFDPPTGTSLGLIHVSLRILARYACIVGQQSFELAGHQLLAFGKAKVIVSASVDGAEQVSGRHFAQTNQPFRNSWTRSKRISTLGSRFIAAKLCLTM